jgi:phosphopantothenoylcysteine decarboxylase/phosphopantothenate--cysteine ligase
VKNPSAQKIKKGNGAPRLELEENPGHPRLGGGQPNPPFCVGFAAESENWPRTQRPSWRRRSCR